MLSKSFLFSIFSSALAHSMVVVGAGSWLYESPHFQVQPAPTSMEFLFSQGEKDSNGSSAKKEIPVPKPKTLDELLKKSEERSKQKRAVEKKETAIHPEKEARKIPGHDIGPLRAGANLNTHGPSLSANSPPKYPRWARRQGIEGTTLLQVSITRTGKAKKVGIKTSSGNSILDEAALKAVKQWQFIPAKKRGIIVTSQLLVPIVFQIKD